MRSGERLRTLRSSSLSSVNSLSLNKVKHLSKYTMKLGRVTVQYLEGQFVKLFRVFIYDLLMAINYLRLLNEK